MPLNFNGRDLLEKCLPTIKEATEGQKFKAEVVVIDNNSSDDSKDYVRKNFPKMKFISFSENKILATYNEAFKQCKSDTVFIMNNDMLLNKNSLQPLYQRLKSDKSYFAVSPEVKAEKDEDRYERRRVGRFRHGHLAAEPHNEEGPGGCLFFHGGAALIHRQKFLELGGFDPLFFYYEDNDLSYRAWKKGWPSIYEPAASVFHLGSQTVNRVFSDTDHKRALKEKANNLFVMKNIKSSTWKSNFLKWNILKTLKLIWTLDSQRAWAWWETMKCKKELKLAEAGKMSDEELMSLIEGLSLKPLPVNS